MKTRLLLKICLASILMFSCAGGATDVNNGGPEICDNGIDDDGDGYFDCDDADCTGTSACINPEICNNGSDDDGDGKIDCADSQCLGRVGPGGILCELQEYNCNDGGDNDGDGLVDCSDPDCYASMFCQGAENCSNGIDDDGDGQVDCADSDCAANPACTVAENCSNGVDDDGDGYIDCADSDCSSAEECEGTEDCTNGIDDDGDWLADCNDPDCASHPNCTGTEICDNGIDDDQNGVTDCVDPACASHPACQPVENCSNGTDDDGDGLIDCADSDCIGQAGNGGTCQATETSCTDSFDNDADGQTDCSDPDCAADAACQTASCTTITEGFESTWLPSGWLVDAYNTSFSWQRAGSEYSPHGGSYVARVPWDDTFLFPMDQDELLATAPITCTGGTLSFWWAASYTYAYNYDVEVYIMVGSTFGDGDEYTLSNGLLLEKGTFTDWTWYQSTFTIPAQYNNIPIRIVWRYIGYDGADFYMDDVQFSN